MAETISTQRDARRPGDGALAWLANSWRILHISAALLALALSPRSYRRAHRDTIAYLLVTACAPNLLWSFLLSALISLVIIRIVVVTAVSYGLSQYALEMLIRVLVLELIPLAAVLLVALRVAVPPAAQIAALRRDGSHGPQSLDPEVLRRNALPLALATMFAVLLLAIVNCVIAAVLSYLSVHGFTLGALASFTRTFGRVFDPTVSLLFAVKTLLFSLAVGLLPVASVLVDRSPHRPRASVQLQAMVRLLYVVLLIEGVSLVGNYA
ncbi:MAG: ABC transporter permease [Betaproteobacteria bacterium]|nr:MAG: ABC transporter permease [Betaproteobacteria bacterium]